MTATESRAGSMTAARAVQRDAADRDERQAARRASARRVAHALEADRVVAGGLGRGPEDRTDRHVATGSRQCRVESARACASTARRSASGPTIARTARGGRSSWPTWTPAAPASRAMSARSFTMTAAPPLRPRATIAARASRSALGRCVLRANLQQRRAAVEAGGREIDERPARARRRRRRRR